jgi:hypothetical protein
MRDSPSAVVVRVAVDRFSGVGPWVDESAHTNVRETATVT